MRYSGAGWIACGSFERKLAFVLAERGVPLSVCLFSRMQLLLSFAPSHFLQLSTTVSTLLLLYHLLVRNRLLFLHQLKLRLAVLKPCNTVRVG